MRKRTQRRMKAPFEGGLGPEGVVAQYKGGSLSSSDFL